LDGGFEPHLFVEENGDRAVEIELLQKGAFFNFAVSYSDMNAGAAFDDLWADFFTFIGGDEIEFVTPLEYAIAHAESVALLSSIAPDWQGIFTELHAPVKREHAVELAEALPRLKMRLAEAIVLSRSDQVESFLPLYLSLDKDAATAMQVLSNPQRYRAVLGGVGGVGEAPEGDQESSPEG
jgi:hypothetical protein